VYLSVTTKEVGEEIEFIWKDSKGKFVGTSHVDLTVGSHARAMFMALERYDSSIRLAYAQYNEYHPIDSARRHIVHFAEQGTAHGVHAATGPELAGPRADRLVEIYIELGRLRRLAGY